VEPEWHRDREYFFTCEIEDNTLNYDISLLIRNNGSYPYQNLWLFCSEDQPIGPARCDTFECLLADEYGKWLGRGVSVYHSRIPLYTRCHFQHKGQYTFSFRHGMRDSTLRGIEQIGMRIEAVK
jgi:gliding motility-associated lipoprotein GldH